MKISSQKSSPKGKFTEYTSHENLYAYDCPSHRPSSHLTHARTHHAINDLPKHNMLPIQPWCLYSGDEELGSVGVLASVGHTQPTRPVVLQLKVLVWESLPIDALACTYSTYNT